MKIAFIFLLIAFISGQVLSILGLQHVTLLDIAVLLLILSSLITGNVRSFDLKNYLSIFGPFLLVVLISLILAALQLTFEEILYSGLYLARFILYSSLILMPNLYPSIKKMLIPSLFIAGVSLATIGLLQYFFYPNLRNLAYLGWDPHEFRVFGTLLDPNFMAIILLLTLIMGIYLTRFYKQFRQLIVIGLLITTCSFLLTYSRGGYVAFVSVATAWLLLKRKFQWLGLLILSFVIVLLILPKPGGEGVDLLRTMSITSRIENSQEAIALFLKNPVFGVGFNTLPFTRLTSPQTSNPGFPKHSVSGFHNSYLFILATTGFIGFVAFLFIWKNLFKILKIASKTGFGEVVNKYGLLLFSLLAIGIHSFFDNSLFYPSVMMWLWLLVGWSLRRVNI